MDFIILTRLERKQIVAHLTDKGKILHFEVIGHFYSVKFKGKVALESAVISAKWRMCLVYRKSLFVKCTSQLGGHVPSNFSSKLKGQDSQSREHTSEQHRIRRPQFFYRELHRRGRENLFLFFMSFPSFQVLSTFFRTVFLFVWLFTFCHITCL